MMRSLVRFVSITLSALFAGAIAGQPIPDVPNIRLIFTVSGSTMHSLAMLRGKRAFENGFFGTEGDGIPRRIPFAEYRVGGMYDIYCRGIRSGVAEITSINLTFGEYGNPDRAIIETHPKGSNPTGAIINSTCFATNYALDASSAVVVKDAPQEIAILAGNVISRKLEATSLKSNVIRDVVASCRYQTLALRDQAQFELVATCSHASRTLGENGAALIAVVGLDRHGILRLHYWNGGVIQSYPYSSDEYYPSGGFTFLDAADLDGDKQPELAYGDSGDGTHLISRRNGVWTEVAESRPGYRTD